MSYQVQLHIKLLSENATVPTKGSPYSAGYDLYSATDTIIKSHSLNLVPTDLSIAIMSASESNTCYYGRVAPRSGLACKFIDVGAGVIDADYRGPVKVVMYNHSDADFQISKGDRIAQLIIEQIADAPIVVLQNGTELPVSQRGSGGFGSTGK